MLASSSSTSYSDTTVNNGSGPYYYAVTAANAGGVSGFSPEAAATPASIIPSTITISGKIQYQDKIYGLNGFTGSEPYKAVRYATVELVSTGTSTTTDANGSYSFSIPPSSASSLYVRVSAAATPPGTPADSIQVKDQSANLYTVGGSSFIPSGDANVNIAIPASSIGGAFNILDAFTNGFQFVYSQAGAYPPALNGYWAPGNTNGTYYCPVSGGCPLGEGIYVLNSPDDTDEYDDDVLYHEFGHFIAAHFSKDDSPGGVHGLTDNDLDMRLAWSEGWGDSMPGNIKMWLANTSQQGLLSSDPTVPLTEYVDTVVDPTAATGSAAGIAIDMDEPDWTYGSYYFYSCGEVAIAKILLDLNIEFGMSGVWDVISSYTTSNPATPVNLELFWDRWHSLGEPTTAPSSVTIDSIFAGRLITYAPDKYDSQTPSDDTVQTAAPYTFGMPQVHTIYGDGDTDYVSFNARQDQHYTITTSRLTNGADTVMTLIDSDQTTTTSGVSPSNPNDNANGTIYATGMVPSDIYWGTICDSYGICHENGNDILGSRLAFTASTTGPYYVKIASSPNRPVSAGRYGSYTLTITSP